MLKNRLLHTGLKYTVFFMAAGWFLLPIRGVAQAQEGMSREVYVESSYRPEIADADKIASLPQITDTFSFNPTIDYTVLPSRIKSDYSLRPIKAAKMVGTPLDKLYNSYVKLGLGNYITPLAEYSIQNLRSKEYAVGAYVFHKSSYADLTLADGTEVPANYAKNDLVFYGKKFYRKFNLFAEAGGKRYSYRNYGLDLDTTTNPYLPSDFTVDGSEIKQNYNKLYLRTGIQSMVPDSGRINYRLAGAANYFWDRDKNKEPYMSVEGNIRVPVRSFHLSLDGNLDYYNLKDTIDTVQTVLYTFRPMFSKGTDLWSIRVGGRISVLQGDTSGKAYLYPDVDFRFKVINNALSLFFGVTGYLEHRSYEDLSLINPYMLPAQQVPRTNHPYIFYGGVDGFLSRKASYRLDLSYGTITDRPFFINYQGELNYWNQFRVVSYNTDLLKLHLEFSWNPLDNLGLFVRTNYYSWAMNGNEQPWHMPNIDLNVSARYNFREKVYAELAFIALGKRQAGSLYNNNSIRVVTLDPIYDLNLKLEYKYSNILSFFLHGYNLINQQYYFWNQYISQGFNLLGGVTYKF